MATVKNVTGDYEIYANNLVVHGNLTVIGAQTNLETANSQVQDNVIILNDGEQGSGVTLGNAGIMIDRGLLSNTYWQWNEPTLRWAAWMDDELLNIQAKDPVEPQDVLTKYYFEQNNQAGGGIAAAPNFLTINNIANDINVHYDGGNLFISPLVIDGPNYNIYNSVPDADLILGNSQIGGNVVVNAPFELIYKPHQKMIPNAAVLWANLPAGGGTGLFVNNATKDDELVSKKKATILAIIFGG
jgi:hypothetical protein